LATRTDISEGYYINADMQLRIPVVNAAGTPYTMTGMLIAFTIRKKQVGGGGTLVFSATIGDNIALANGTGTNDVAVVTIPIADYESVTLSEASTYEYALWRYDTGSKQPLK
jgi:hypothetical protein